MTKENSNYDRPTTILELESITEMSLVEIAAADPEWIKKIAMSAITHIKTLQRQRNDLKRKEGKS